MHKHDKIENEVDRKPLPPPLRSLTIKGTEIDAIVFALGITAKKQPQAFGIDLKDLKRKLLG